MTIDNENQTTHSTSVDAAVSVQRDDVDTITHSDSSKRLQTRSRVRMIPLGQGLYRVIVPRNPITGRYKLPS